MWALWFFWWLVDIGAGGEGPEWAGGFGLLEVPGGDFPVVGGGVGEAGRVVGGLGDVVGEYGWCLCGSEVDVVSEIVIGVRVGAGPEEEGVDGDVVALVGWLWVGRWVGSVVGGEGP